MKEQHFPFIDATRASLSPLAGVSDRCFRAICSYYGASAAVTEMVSAKAMYYNDTKSAQLLEVDPNEGPVGCQLFGSDPEIIAKVIERDINPREDLAWIDLNMGCPAPKITKNGEGSALMKNPDLARRVMRAMVRSANKPVTVKFRLGWEESSKNFLEIGRIAQEEGVAAVTLHARTTKQMYTGKADWSAIAELAKALEIPVIGNGDVDSPEAAKRMLAETGCRSVAIGRAAMGNPFLFREIAAAFRGEVAEKPSNDELMQVIRRHYDCEIAQKGERIAILEMRKHIQWYLKGKRGANLVKQKINVASTRAEVDDILEQWKAHTD